MTDREKLIELLQCSPTDVMGNHGVGAMADHLIANGVTIQQWIPVTERLPEDDLPKDSKRKSIKVLVTYKTPTGIPVF